MSEHVIKNNEQEKTTPGMAFMGFLMATAAIGGMYSNTIDRVVSIELAPELANNLTDGDDNPLEDFQYVIDWKLKHPN